MRSLRSSARDDTRALEVSGPIRAHSHVPVLVRQARPGDVLVIDLMDIDRMTASQLIAAKPAAVINVASSMSGRYPNRGPALLAQAHVPHVDQVDRAILAIGDGTTVTVNGGKISRGDQTIATGRCLDTDSIEAHMAEATPGLTVQLEAFTANAMDHVAHDAGVLLDGEGLPELDVDLSGTSVLIVDEGFGWEQDLALIKPFVKRRKLIIIATSRVADRVRELVRPATIVVGDPIDAREDTLAKSAHVLVHGAAATSAGVARLESLGVAHTVHDSQMSNVNLAILLAHAQGADVMVAVGIPSRLLDYIDDGADDAAGTFLARLQVGSSLIDARALAEVYRGRSHGWVSVVVLLAASVTLAAAIWWSPDARAWVTDVASSVQSWWEALSS